jgi:uncharacterized damage-inducible protein DinB
MVDNAPVFQVQDRDFLVDLTACRAGFHPASVILSGLTSEQANAKPAGVPHSIAQIAAHIWFYLELFNHAAREGFPRLPEHAAVGWPEPGDWESLRTKVLASIDEAQQLATTSSRLDSKFLPEGDPTPFMQRDSNASALVHGAMHAAHHLGQIVTIRQILGLWPPPAGPLTW